jgi:vacuolar-type H+-ATPase subunit H
MKMAQQENLLDRVQRLKDARSEAAKDIEELKAQKNTEYQNFVAQVTFKTTKGGKY